MSEYDWVVNGTSSCSDKEGGKMYGEGSEPSKCMFLLSSFASLHLPPQGRSLNLFLNKIMGESWDQKVHEWKKIIHFEEESKVHQKNNLLVILFTTLLISSY